MNKPKIKFPSILALLLAALFCVSAQAVNNPVSYETEINDCDVIKYNGEYYIQGNWLKGDMLSSRDLVSWGQRKHVFSWNNTWHTQVNGTDPDYDIHGTHIRYHNGTFHLYAHLDVVDGITHAVSDNIWGPYTEPVDSQFAIDIDGETFLDDDGSLHFYTTKFSGGNGNWYRAMSDPSTFSGSYVRQVYTWTGSGDWENGTHINEGPKVFKYRNRYYHLYAAYPTSDPNYSIGCVEASSPTAFSNSGKYSAPICTRYTPPGKPEIAYIGQPWVVDGVNGFEKWLGYFAQTTSDGRTQRIDRMHFFDRTLYVDGPTDRWTPGYHPAPAKPQYGGTFSVDSASLPSDWTASGGTWSVAGGELRQSASGSPRATLDRDAAENYLFEINLKFNGSTTDQQAGARVYYVDADNWMIVGIHQTSTPGFNNFYYHLREGGVDNVQAVSLPESVLDLNVYHKIRVQRSGNTFRIWLDDVLRGPVDVATASNFGPSQVALYANNADVFFDGIIYTVGWDEYGSEVAGWGNSVNGLPMAGSRSYGTGGVTVNNGHVYKGDLMPEYEFSAQVYQDSGTGSMGLAAVAIDNNNYLNAVINLSTDQLIVSGVHNGFGFSEPGVSVANKTDYNIRVAKLSDRMIFFVDGEEKLSLNISYGASTVGLIASGMNARFNGILCYRTEPDVVPSEWTAADVGSPGFAGTIKEYDNALYMTGSGADIWHLADEFAFAQKDVSGDWEFTTRVVNHDRTHYWAKAGLMFRDNLATNSPMVNLNVTPRDLGMGGVHLHWRNLAGSGTGAIDVFDLQYPIWLKLKREGSLFTGYYSSDGQSWTQLGTCSPPVNTAGKVGYSLCALNNDRIARAMFDNSEFIVPPLDPGVIGNSQVIYEDEDPDPFTSVAPAVGTGVVSYQWQWDMAGDALPWQDLADETNATYTAPNLNGAFPTNTTLYARRKATDAYYTEYSNEVSLQIKKVFDTSGPYIFIDNYNTIDTADVNWDYEARQAGGGGTSLYSGHTPHYSVAGSKMKNVGIAGFLQLDEDMAHYIVGEDFEFSFKVSILDTTSDWTSIYLHDETNTSDPRADSRLGIYFLGSANTDFIGAIYKGVASRVEEGITVAEVEALTGVPYNKADEHAFKFVSHALPGAYDLWIDGVKVRSGVPYAFDGAERRIGIVGVLGIASPGALYDDVSLRYHSGTYAKWSDDHGLTGANTLRSADVEPDGMDNLLEYALGGNPNIDDASTVLPTYDVTDTGGGTSMVDYVYRRRLDAAVRGLTYGLETSTNLLSAWTYIGATYETDTAGIDPDFESVSNSVPFDTEEGFIQLEITED